METNKEMTAEEIQAQKNEMYNFYTENKKYLEAQVQYEDLMLKLDEIRYKRFETQLRHAMLLQTQEEETKGDQEKEVKSVKKLRRE